MAGTPKVAWDEVSDDQLKEAWGSGGGWPGAARLIGVKRNTLESHLQSHRPHLIGWAREQRTGVSAGDGRLRAVESGDPAEWGDIRRLLADRGLNLDDWIVTKGRVNEWGDPAALNTQLRVEVVPRMGLLVPPRADGWKRTKLPAKPGRQQPRLILATADHHVPFQDEALHAAMLRWIADFKPDEGIVLGDVLDLAEVSRHRKRPEFATQLNDTLAGGYGLLRDYVTAGPGTYWRMLAGNHEDRIRNAVIENLSALHGVRRPPTESDDDPLPVLSIPFLLRLDELGIEWCDAGGEYHSGQIVVTDTLVARHGWIAKPGAGRSAHATVEALRFSCLIGHVHRQGITQVTVHHPVTGEPSRLLGVELGTMGQIRSGSGLTAYIPSSAPDWQAGAAAITVHEDGTETAELLTWNGSTLFFRDWSCKP